MENKSWYKSRTLWVNTLAAVAMVVQSFTGFVVEPEAQAGVLAVLNLILRAVTKAGLEG